MTLPLIQVHLCTGCGHCIAVCPTQCLEPIQTIAWLPRPGDCINCTACQIVCPEDAIRMLPAGRA